MMAAEHGDSDRRIGAALRNARLSRAQTQAELAVVLGVSRSTLALYESGRRPLPTSTLLAAAHALQLPARLLLPPDGHGDAGTANVPAQATLAEPLATVVRMLEERPTFTPSVLDLLATLLEREQVV